MLHLVVDFEKLLDAEGVEGPHRLDRQTALRSRKVDHSAKSQKHKKGAPKERHWPLIAVSVAGLLTIGHAVGGVAGLIEGYREIVQFFRSEPVQAQATPKPASHLMRLVANLRAEFNDVKINLEQAKAANFVALEETFATLKKLDKDNPNVPYFHAEIARMKDTAHFDSETCLRLPDQGTINLKALHTLFFHYLEAARTAEKTARGTDASAQACYDSEIGVCLQRTAWVNHLLANDYYEFGIRTTDRDKAIGYLTRARDHAKSAKDYHPPKGPVGFTQCIDTVTLERKIVEKLHSFESAAVVTGKTN